MLLKIRNYKGTHLKANILFFSTKSSLFKASPERRNPENSERQTDKYISCQMRDVTKANLNSLPKNLGDDKERVTFQQWLQSPEVRKAKSFNGSGFGLGPRRDQPFPLNPTFRPARPTSHSARMQISDEYLKGVSIDVLARKYKTCPQRVEAILKLRNLFEERQSQNAPVLSSYANVMERMVNACNEPSRLQFNDHEDLPIQSRATPLWKSIPEDHIFTAEEAAKTLRWPSLEEIAAKNNSSGHNKIKGAGDGSLQNDRLVAVDETQTGKRIFRLVDLSNGDLWKRDTAGNIYVTQRAATSN
ncbi:ribosomal protein subunit S35 [Schizosaccharomyces cryophilus OY26]|uniref:Ribosomal protein subunit S35 n=1 Tax=Schizosaccharomyces cryophilus (strain OY26 / ATCC MYA-4695 / CBS 11777 / NBRC 106824 / NRRL Y48691) TaxID=653667 RepID=S9VNH7_SCHCR|nr:ribosomal protein subunit S35 [Schizosaccharomyces cryophilus OY26]EPY49508.1 ribosomal protein subunit S35 [Schizosaccharomyces cryophilus OY26]